MCFREEEGEVSVQAGSELGSEHKKLKKSYTWTPEIDFIKCYNIKIKMRKTLYKKRRITLILQKIVVK